MSGPWSINGIEQPDPMPCQLPPGLDAILAATEARDKQEREDRLAKLTLETSRAMHAAAANAVEGTINNRVARFRKNPLLLNNIPSLDAFLAPSALIARAEALLEHERSVKRRWRGMGGESVEITLRSVIRYAEGLLAEEMLEAAE